MGAFGFSQKHLCNTVESTNFELPGVEYVIIPISFFCS